MEATRIKELMIRKISGTGSQQDLLELEALLRGFPAYKLLHDVLATTVSVTDGTPGEKDIEAQLNTLWKKINQDSAARSPIKSTWHSRYSYRLAVAAVFVAFISAGIFGYRMHIVDAAPKFRTITAAYGHTSKVVLPDGSVVKLNSGTTLTYPLKFNDQVRQVTLVGEAFFDVTKNPDRPFLVHAEHLTIRVLGTAFNVKAYREDINVETTLIEGKIQVLMNNEPDKTIMLSPHEKLTVSKHTTNSRVQPLPGELKLKIQAIAVKPSANIEEIAWIDHKLAFNNTSFEQVVKMIERKYNVKIVCQQEQLKSELITGAFENESLPRALHLLQMSTNFSYEIRKDSVILSTINSAKR